MEYLAIALTKIYNVFILVPRWLLVILTGAFASTVINLLHSTKKPAKPKNPAKAVIKNAQDGSQKTAPTPSTTATTPTNKNTAKGNSNQSTRKRGKKWCWLCWRCWRYMFLRRFLYIILLIEMVCCSWVVLRALIWYIILGVVLYGMWLRVCFYSSQPSVPVSIDYLLAIPIRPRPLPSSIPTQENSYCSWSCWVYCASLIKHMNEINERD